MKVMRGLTVLKLFASVISFAAVAFAIFVTMTALGRSAPVAIHSDRLGPNTLPLANVHGSPAVSGSYAGPVTFEQPMSLGSMELSLDLSDVDGSIAGAINVTRTLAFSGTHQLIGSITTPSGSITPTLTLISVQPITSLISGREVTRSIRIEGEVIEDGDVFRGTYHETIEGFTPKPMQVRGKFLFVRRSRTPYSAEPVETPTPTPTSSGTPATPTSTYTPTPTKTPASTYTPTPTKTPSVTYTPTATPRHKVSLPLVIKGP